MLETSLPSMVPLAHHFSHTSPLDVLQTFQESSHLGAFAKYQPYIKYKEPLHPSPSPGPALFLHTALRTMTLHYVFTYSPEDCLTSPLEYKHHMRAGTLFVLSATASPEPRTVLAQGGLHKRIYRTNKQ